MLSKPKSSKLPLASPEMDTMSLPDSDLSTAPANEPTSLASVQVSMMQCSQLIGDSSMGEINDVEQKLSTHNSPILVPCKAERSVIAETVDAQRGSLQALHPLSDNSAQSSTLGITSPFDENNEAHLSQGDAGIDLERGRDSAANLIERSVDLEKDVSSLSPQSQSNHVKYVVQENFDRNESSEERLCRVCYLGHTAQPESGPAIELGCECKHDLAFAHRQCAEAWFKIKGNRTCEICGSTVHNVSGSGDATFMDNWNDGHARADEVSNAEHCWQNHRLFNILLACMVFAFVLPWVFHVSAFFR